MLIISVLRRKIQADPECWGVVSLTYLTSSKPVRDYVSKNKSAWLSWAVVVHTFNPSTQEAEACGSLWIRGQPGLQEIVSEQAPKLQSNPVSKNQNQTNVCGTYVHWNCPLVSTVTYTGMHIHSQTHKHASANNVRLHTDGHAKLWSCTCAHKKIRSVWIWAQPNGLCCRCCGAILPSVLTTLQKLPMHNCKRM